MLIPLCLVGLGGIALTASFPGPNANKARRVSSAALKLPAGTSKAQVAALLAREGLEFSCVGSKQGIDDNSEVMFNDYTSADLSGYCVAIIRRTTTGLLISVDMQYYFFFDKKDKLLKGTAKERWTGP